MTQIVSALGDLVRCVKACERRGRRRLVALAGAPASGKSTLAARLTGELNATGCAARVLGMDGFHLDNALLTRRGLLSRKGAPESFDAAGFAHAIHRCRDEDEVILPVFDRGRDLAVAGADHVGPECDTVVVEGNYLLLDAPVWRDLAPMWDVSVFVDTPQSLLRDRLIARWLEHGLDRQAAVARAEGNDLANAARIEAARLPADIVLRVEGR